MTLRGVTNGTAGPKTVQVDTTTDADTATSTVFQVVAGNSVNQPTVTIADPSAATGARTRYVIGFTVSATGGLSGEAGSEITLTLPAGTTAPEWQSGTIHDVTRNVDVGTCTNPGSGLVSTCGFFSSGVRQRRRSAPAHPPRRHQRQRRRQDRPGHDHQRPADGRVEPPSRS